MRCNHSADEFDTGIRDNGFTVWQCGYPGCSYRYIDDMERIS